MYEPWNYNAVNKTSQCLSRILEMETNIAESDQWLTGQLGVNVDQEKKELELLSDEYT